jgi:hypothetical protein
VGRATSAGPVTGCSHSPDRSKLSIQSRSWR